MRNQTQIVESPRWRSEIAYHTYLKRDNDPRLMFRRELLSLNEAAALVAEWSYLYECDQKEPDLDRHCARIIDATTQLALLGTLPLTIGDYCCTFGTEDDDGVSYNYVLPDWSLYYPLPLDAWPDNPVVLPFAVMGGMGLMSPFPIEGLKCWDIEFQYKQRTLTVPQRFMDLGGWHSLATYANKFDLVAQEAVDIGKVVQIHTNAPDTDRESYDYHTHGLELFGHKEFQVLAPGCSHECVTRLLYEHADAVINGDVTYAAGDVAEVNQTLCTYQEVGGESDEEPARLRIVDYGTGCDEIV